MPVVSGVGAECFHLTVQLGANLEIQGTNSLTVYGNLVIDGSFIANQSTLRFAGPCWAPTISGSGTSVYNLIGANPAPGVLPEHFQF